MTRDDFIEWFQKQMWLSCGQAYDDEYEQAASLAADCILRVVSARDEAWRTFAHHPALDVFPWSAAAGKDDDARAYCEEK